MNELHHQSIMVLKDFIKKANRIVNSNYITHLKKKKKILLQAENGLAECLFKFTLKNGLVTSFKFSFERKNIDGVMNALNTGNNQYFVNKSKEPMKFFQNSPDRESIEALALNLRFFSDDKEKISLSNIEKLYKKLKLPVIAQEYSKIRYSFNNYLNSKSYIASIAEKSSITHRNIFQIYLYGDLAHLNPKKREIFLQWQRNPLKSIIFDASFIFIAISFSTVLEEMIKKSMKVPLIILV